MIIHLYYTASLFRREVIIVLDDVIKNLAESTGKRESNNMIRGSVIGKKSELKINILNLLKLAAKHVIGYHLMINMNDKLENAVNFLSVLKLFENQIFGDVFYDLNFRQNINNGKPVNLSNDDDVQMLMKEFPAESYPDIRAAGFIFLIIYNACCWGEPGRLFLFPWQ